MRWDVYVGCAMNQEYRNACLCEGLRGTCFIEIDAVSDLGVELGEFNWKRREVADNGIVEARDLHHALGCYRFKACKWRLGYGRANAVIFCQSLKHDGCAHRLTKAVNTSGCMLRNQPRNPVVYIVTLLNPIGNQVAAAFSVSARVGKQDAVAGVEQERCETGYTLASVTKAVQQNHRAAVCVSGFDVPRAQNCAVVCCD